ncbi:MAG: DegT/DnrJ/EryC1/StrS family aminotransferase, partial [Dehalococcoidia bacterium]
GKGLMIPVTELGRIHAALGEELNEAVTRVLASNWFILGPELETFEQAFAAACGTSYAVGCSSGTDAITLALRALGIGAGDEVIVPAFTAAPTIGGVVDAGATPVFADVEPCRRTLDPASVERAITNRTRALLPVHLYGRPANMEALSEIASRHDLLLIEDAAQAHGARWRGKPAGSLGVAACFSFYPTKNLGALGDGGAVTTNDAAVAERLRRLRNHGQSGRYHHVEHSGNSRLDEIQSAILTAKLAHLERWNQDRRAQAARYLKILSDAPVRLPSVAEDEEPCWHLFVVASDEREVLRNHLRAAGVGSDIHYPMPVHLQPAYAGFGNGPGSLPVSERLATTVLSLPLFPGLMPAEQDQVAAAMRSCPR